MKRLMDCVPQSSLDELILDTCYQVGRHNEVAWVWLAIVHKEFKVYAFSDEGVREYVRLYTEQFNTKTFKYTKLFGKFHSLFGEPAAEWSNGDKSWYYNGLLQRSDDKPSVIEIKRDLRWPHILERYFHSGKLIREEKIFL